MDEDNIKKFLSEYGERSVTLTLNQLGLLMAENINTVVSIEEMMSSEISEEERAVNFALFELLMKFCASLLTDIYNADELEIEDTDGGNL